MAKVIRMVKRPILKVFVLVTLYTLSGVLSVDHFTGGSLVRLDGVSFTKCKNECIARGKCEFVRYFRLFQYCQLFPGTYDPDTLKGPAVYIYRKTNYLHNSTEYSANCGQCSSREDCVINMESGVASCVIDGCMDPGAQPEMTTYGTMYNKGSMVKYVCNYPWRRDYIIRCRNNGDWTPTTFKCTCDFSLIKNSVSVSRVDLNQTHVEGKYQCRPGYEARYGVRQECDLMTGKMNRRPNWNVCCDVVTKDGWTKVLRHGAGQGQNMYRSWRLHSTPIAGHLCRFRNSTILDNWQTFNVQKVKVDIVKNETSVAYIIFNGTNTSYMDWFNGSRLLESSWDDLTPSADPIIEFNLKGRHDNRGVITSFIILHNSANKCSGDLGWLMVSRDNNTYNCERAMEGLSNWIVYAKHNKSGIFAADDSRIGYADRIDIWVQF